ncbi:uncharacterized protein LOC141630879 [Silene latifolia]|uniref:uncharacterized protein LOC141630879 n=1 Tax=Silene latifolia TaxID=37657 RepID=UPI003D78B018
MVTIRTFLAVAAVKKWELHQMDVHNAPRCWFVKLAGALRAYGFLQSYSDYSLFTYSRDKDLGPLKYFLGRKVALSTEGIFLNQRKYALGIVSETGLQFTLHLAQNPVFHKRAKHIDIDYHFVRDAIMDCLIATSHVSTNEQLPDIFTKALGVSQFTYIRCKLDIIDLHAPI